MKRPRRDPPAKRRTPHALLTYRAKRNFDTTPEPAGELRTRATTKKNARRGEFVVQRHDATRLHYDVRIEIDGAMMSWAVPKGPSYDPSVKRLAVETEDHPMAYNRFEGRIPDGEYGAGDVLVWDRGTYETVPPGAAHAMRAKGHLHVRFFGEKLRGEWHFVRTRRGDAKNQWLMFKARDAAADAAYDVVADKPGSIVSARTATRGPRRAGASKKGLTAPALLAAMGDVEKATLVDAIDDPGAWRYEIKYDGYRALAARSGDEVRLASRNAKDWSARFGAITAAVGALDVGEVVLDGEICALDAQGRPSFALLQHWLGGEAPDAVIAYVVFDLLWLDGRDLRARPLEERQELLRELLRDAKAPLSVSSALEGDVAAMLGAACAGGLEGVIAKRRGSPYRSGRSRDWLKLKCGRRQELAIVGYTPQKNASGQLGALLLAVHDADGTFRYAGKVGTGFDAAERRRLAARLDAARRDAPTAEGAPRMRDARWSKPREVAEIAFTEWTDDGRLRHPVYVGLREDKRPDECVREVPRSRVATPRIAAATAREPRAPETALSNPGKVLFPVDAITKADVAKYYADVAPFMLPHLRGRPLALQRWPNGIASKSWFQQNAPPEVPSFVRTLQVDGGRRLVADNPETLAWLANLAALTLHMWSSHVNPRERAAALAHPDYVIFDLDPGERPWADVIDVAKVLHALLDGLSLPSHVKTSGKSGLHILVPVRRTHSHDEVVAFAERVAMAVARERPAIATTERMKAKRGGRLYVDYMQNGEGKTIVAPYTLRALDGAPVSTPVKWSEVTTRLDPSRFTLRTVRRRLAKYGDLFAGVLDGTAVLPKVR